MLARRQELNTQLQVLIDAFLLAFSLWAAYARDRLSLALGFKILLRTIPAVILGLGVK